MFELRLYERRAKWFREFEDIRVDVVFVTPTNFKEVAAWVNGTTGAHAMSMSSVIIRYNCSRRPHPRKFVVVRERHKGRIYAMDALSFCQVFEPSEP